MIQLLAVSKKPEPVFVAAIDLYEKRLKHYTAYKAVEITPSAKKEIHEIREEEAQRLLKTLHSEDYLILLDDKGETQTTEAFAQLIQRRLNDSTRKTVFCIGGAYGFSEAVYKRCNMKLSLSAMTLPHQLCRLVFTEQLYRAFTLLRGEKYHHA